MIQRLRDELHSPLTKQLFREKEGDFTRQRKLSFERVAVTIISGHKKSLQNGVNQMFSQSGEVERVPTASAYSQAREKLRAEVFVHLNRMVSEGFYAAEPDKVKDGAGTGC